MSETSTHMDPHGKHVYIYYRYTHRVELSEFHSVREGSGKTPAVLCPWECCYLNIWQLICVASCAHVCTCGVHVHSMWGCLMETFSASILATPGIQSCSSFAALRMSDLAWDFPKHLESKEKKNLTALLKIDWPSPSCPSLYFQKVALVTQEQLVLSYTSKWKTSDIAKLSRAG